MRANLVKFLKEMVTVAVENDVRLALHPDDPPFSLIGLPRVVSALDDIATILGAVDHEANGITHFAGSYGLRPGNDLPEMAASFAHRMHFAIFET